MPGWKPAGLGRPWPVRRLHPAERHLAEGHLLRLGREDRLMRFCHTAGDAAISAYCAGMDWDAATVLGCFPDGRLRGLAELIPAAPSPGQSPWPRAAELALSVERDFQDQGIGSALLRQTLLAARNRLIGPVRMICLPENKKMQRIALKFGARLDSGDGQTEGRILLPLPSHRSRTLEAAQDCGRVVRCRL